MAGKWKPVVNRRMFLTNVGGVERQLLPARLLYPVRPPLLPSKAPMCLPPQ